MGLLGLGCETTDLSSDQALYLQLIESRVDSVAEGVTACSVISSSHLREDCQIHMLQVGAGRGGSGLQALCTEIEPGRVESECWFLAAEVAKGKRQYREAAIFCEQSGAFASDCGQHLWQTALRRLAHRKGPPDFPGNVAQAQALYEQWEPLLGAFTDIERRFWPRFYSNGYEGGGGVDLTWCEGLDGEHRERCEVAGVEVYGRELAPRLDEHQIDLCELDSPTSETLEQWLPARPHARLDALLMERVANTCTSKTE